MLGIMASGHAISMTCFAASSNRAITPLGGCQLLHCTLAQTGLTGHSGGSDVVFLSVTGSPERLVNPSKGGSS